MRNPTKDEVNFKSCGTPGNHDSASWPIILALKGALQQTVSLRLIKTTESAFCTILSLVMHMGSFVITSKSILDC